MPGPVPGIGVFDRGQTFIALPKCFLGTRWPVPNGGHAREGGHPVRRALSFFVIRVSGILDRPPSRAMTAGGVGRLSLQQPKAACLRIPAAEFARVLLERPPSLKSKRAQGMPGAGCTHGHRANRLAQKRALTDRFSRDIPAFPAQWFTACFELSPVIPACLSPSPARCACIVADLAPASGRQNHTTSPSASVSHVLDTSASTASRLTCRDVRDTPLSGRGGMR